MIKELTDVEKIYGTSFHGITIETTADDLINVLGFEPIQGSSDGKTNFEWRIETEYGAFCIYDWKEGRAIRKSEIIEWHIGGTSKELETRLFEEISGLLI